MSENKKNKTKSANKFHKNFQNEKVETEKENENLESECGCSDENCNCENESCNHESTVETCREDEFKENLQRLQAEFDNYRKRNESLQEKVREDGIVYAISRLLPVLDSFKSAKQKIEDEEFLKSLNLIEKQFLDGLNELKVEKIDAENTQFNPNFHNAVLTGLDPEKPDNEILEVYQDGYKLNNKIIRHSVVKINKLN